jgi:putative phosphotransacetylase
MNSVLVGVSNHHIHLSKEDMIKLFGKEELEVLREIRQPGQFAAKETVNLIGNHGIIWNIRIVGPLRKETQVEIMRIDQKILGIKAPILVSGNLDGSPGMIIQGPNGAVKIDKGVIIAKVHVHLSVNEAKDFRLNDGDKVDVYHKGKLIIKDVIVRSGELHKSHLHIDKEEAELLKLKNDNLVELRF